MAVPLTTTHYNQFEEMRRVVSVYADDSDHVLRRRFVRLHLYNLYHKHKRLVDLDRKISMINHASPISDTSDALEDLLQDIGDKLSDFDKASKIYQHSIQAPQPPKFFLNQLRAASRKKEQDYYYHYDVEAGWSECALHAASEKGLIHRCIDRCITHISFFRWLFIKDRENQHGLMLQYSEGAVRLIEDISINLGFCALLLLPTFLLSYLESRNGKLVVVAGFVLISTFLSSFMATARQKPSLAIVAGYAAILVVFLGGSSQ